MSPGPARLASEGVDGAGLGPVVRSLLVVQGGAVTVVGVAVMAVPERADRVSRLLERLDLDESAVSWDPDRIGHARNWWRACRLAAGRPWRREYEGRPVSHALVLEDDVTVCRDLVPAVERIVRLHPHDVLGLYANRREVDVARAQGRSLVRVRDVWNDQAFCYPLGWLAALRRDFLAHPELDTQDAGADGLRRRLRPGLETLVTAPSLVDHALPTDSTLGHNHPSRRARWFLGEEVSALSIDWSRGPSRSRG